MAKIKKRKNPTPVQAVDRAARILQALAADPQGLVLSKLGKKVNLLPQTAQNILRTLESHQLVSQAGRGKPYTLGGGLFRLIENFSEHRNHAELARPIVERLAKDINEYILLGKLQGDMLHTMISISSQQALRVSGAGCLPNHLHAMAAGKVLMAFLPQPRQGALLEIMELTALTEHTITDREQLRKELTKIRKTGFAATKEEGALGVIALAVPVRDEAGNVIAALATSHPSLRHCAKYEKTLREKLTEAAKKIETAWAGA